MQLVRTSNAGGLGGGESRWWELQTPRKCEDLQENLMSTRGVKNFREGYWESEELV